MQYDQGLELWEDIATTLNTIIQKTGKKIDADNKDIWQGFLHKWGNDEWIEVLDVFAQAVNLDPTVLKPFHRTAFESARATVLKGKNDNERTLDQRANKKIAWQMIMTLREVWNSLNNLHIPNEDLPKRKRNKVTIDSDASSTRITIWHDLFEID